MLKALTKIPRWQRTLIVLFFSQILGSSTGMSVELLAGLVFSAQAFTMMLAAPVWGRLADRYGRKLMIIRASFGGAIVLLMMAFVQTAEQLVALRALQGLISGIVAANSALLAAQVPRERMGYAMGTLQVGLGAGVAFGPLIGGIVADTFGYASAFYDALPGRCAGYRWGPGGFSSAKIRREKRAGNLRFLGSAPEISRRETDIQPSIPYPIGSEHAYPGYAAFCGGTHGRCGKGE